MKEILKVSDRMTHTPYFVAPDVAITEAWDLMRREMVRHLPVEENGRFVGMISERTLRLAFSYEGADRMLVRDVMSTKPYTVDPSAPLYGVVLDMAEHRYGAAVVIEGGKAIGIFTTVDGLRVLGEMLKSEVKKVA